MSPQAPLPAATFVYKSDPVRGRQWAEVFRAQAPEIDFRIWPDMGDPAKVRFLAALVLSGAVSSLTLAVCAASSIKSGAFTLPWALTTHPVGQIIFI